MGGKRGKIINDKNEESNGERMKAKWRFRPSRLSARGSSLCPALTLTEADCPGAGPAPPGRYFGAGCFQKLSTFWLLGPFAQLPAITVCGCLQGPWLCREGPRQAC